MYDARTLYGIQTQVPSGSGAASPMAYMGTDNIRSGVRGLLDPHNPLVWLGGLLLVTVGAAAFAGSVKLGPARVSAAVGKG